MESKMQFLQRGRICGPFWPKICWKELSTLAVLPTGWLFGRINKRGRIKIGGARQICGQILAVLYRKGQQGGQTSDNFAFLLLLSIKIGTSRKYFTFPTDKDQDCFFFWSTNAVKKVKITRGPNFSSVAEFFPPNWPERSAKSWQHWIPRTGTAYTVGEGGEVHLGCHVFRAMR